MFAAAGVCVGLSDVWRFPHLLVEHGTLWFPLLYLAGVILIGVPLLVGELALARLGHSRPAENFGFLVAGTRASPLWQYAGIAVLIVVFLILSYSTVVAGWMMAYTVRAFIGGLGDVSAGAARVMFHTLITDSERLLGWHTLFVVALGWVAARGINDGVGRFSRLLVIAVFGIALLLAGSSLFEYGLAPVTAVEWHLHWSDLSVSVVLDAVIQAFFTLGVCMGAMMILGCHLPPDTKLGSLVLGIAAVDVLFVTLACMGVMPLVLSVEEAGEGISFVMETVPLALAGAPLAPLYLGVFYALLFLLVSTTALVLMEFLVSWASEKTRKTRSAVAPAVAAGVWIGGVLALLSFGVLSFEFEFVGEEKDYGLFDVMNILSSQILLPIIGLLMAVFVGWSIDKETFSRVVGQRHAAAALRRLQRYLVPAAVVVILVALVFGRVLPRV